MRGWWREIAGLVLPVACAGCGCSRTRLCDTCGHALYGGAAGRVRPVPMPAGLPDVHAAAPYTDAVRAVLLAHKERGAIGLARPLGAALAAAVQAAVRPHGAVRGAPLLLVPVPSARPAVRARGHDAVRRVAVAAAAELRRSGTPARALPVLRHRRRVADQAGLGARERLANMTGALTVVAGAGPVLAGGRIVVVDDLMTTGASLVEASRALSAACAPPAPGLTAMAAAVVAAPADAFAPHRPGTRGTPGGPG
ncbi:ComF family protein [Streptomyces sp. NPDC047928]|uniref:ComF family protein n=1 Tax=unclassified Streptomyces TaxID=2593676 RepID=UPI00372255F4